MVFFSKRFFSKRGKPNIKYNNKYVVWLNSCFIPFHSKCLEGIWRTSCLRILTKENLSLTLGLVASFFSHLENHQEVNVDVSFDPGKIKLSLPILGFSPLALNQLGRYWNFVKYYRVFTLDFIYTNQIFCLYLKICNRLMNFHFPYNKPDRRVQLIKSQRVLVRAQSNGKSLLAA